MRERRGKKKESLAGSILLAHPSMRDGHFRRTVVLMTAHNADGAMGVVMNRPLRRQLGEMGGEFSIGPLAAIPLFQGGPVQIEQLIFAAWRPNFDGFQLHLGVDSAKATQLLSEDGAHVRAFLGYASWSAGQLEKELKHDTWIVTEPPADLFAHPSDTSLWQNVLSRAGAEWRLLAEEPDDPENN